ncbi:MAG: glycosyltransferase family 4 protein [Planctomycetes bacterium]|nr:glycosyltransferase family 4 protein [Planctomycetota bacterium]
MVYSMLTGPVAIVSHTFSPDLNGQSIVLSRLLEGIQNFVRISSDRFWRPHAIPGVIDERVATPWAIRKSRKLRFIEGAVFRLHVWHRAQGIERAIVRHRCSSVVACTGGDLVDLPAAIVAAEQSGVPCVLYYFDDYRSQWKIPNPAWSTKWMHRNGEGIEAEVLRKAAGVIVPNELSKIELTERVALPVTIIRNPVQLDLYEKLRATVNTREESPLRRWSIVYTGSIYEAQLDAVRNCARGLDLLRGRGIDATLHLFTAQSEASLFAKGIPASVQIHSMVTLQEASRIQCEADILLLPLAFETRYPELIRTSAPGKLGEYLASGRPILVHAPADSFLSRFAMDERWGLVCDTPNEVRIADSIEQMIRGPQLRMELVQGALDASQQFSEAVNREKFVRFLQASAPFPKSKPTPAMSA